MWAGVCNNCGVAVMDDLLDAPRGRRKRRWLRRSLQGLAALLVLGLGKAWFNRQRVWQTTPIMVDSAFGTFAASPRQASVQREVLRVLPATGGAPYRLFAYPGDAWLYLTLPADNPTPYSLLRPVYSTPEQTQTAIDHVERDPQAAVFVNALFAKPTDPFVRFVEERFQPPIHLEVLPFVVYLR